MTLRRESRWGRAVAVGVLAAAPAPGLSAQSAVEFVPVTDAMLQDPAPGDWLTWRRTLDGWGYSPLDQIDRDNVHRIRMVWSRGLAEGRQEGTPLAYGGVLYMPQSSDVIEAIDAVTGDLVWQHRRELPDDVYEFVGGNARNNRNIAIYDRFIINTSDDDYIFGLDAAARTESRSRTYAIAYRHQLAPGTEFAGTVRAISAETGRTTWLHEQRAATMSLVATAGGLVFGGD
ncbi:MAG: PQQ-binding-like beta-propeller repeat protein, partial [Acidobacteria bacterium]|nr:PQQ-binding-like beta-propeller repeat protein [Acidobacteriota bacterium]